MFVLPPPPVRYNPNGTNAWSPVPGVGMPLPVLETNNTIAHPEGPEYTFSTGEGNYTLREDIHLATPPPHPSEAPITNPNPLSTAPQPIIAGTRLSFVQLKYRAPPIPVLYRNPALGYSKDTQATRESGSASGVGDTTDDETSSSGNIPERFGSGNTSLATAAGKGPKKPKSNIAKSNSSFVSRIITHEHLSKRLGERNQEDLFVFANNNRAFNWLDLDSVNKQDPLSKILFTKSHPICHDVNVVTRGAHHLDVVIGFSTGDIIWFDPISNKYTRINKNGCINNHAVMEIKWLPSSENLFLAAHVDGSLVVYDKEKEDAPFFPEDIPYTSSPNPNPNPEDPSAYFQIKKSVRSTNQKTNPVSYWTVAREALTGFAFSPDCEHLAVVSEDETLKVISFVKEKLLDVYRSYYGGLTCVCWSPDGRYVVTGGQDDLVSIWSIPERRIVARCEGHHSWVSSVAFDPWRCDDRTYRFGSVGHDCRLLLWDFSVGMLHKPKAAVAHQHKGSMSSSAPGAGRQRAESQSTRFRSNSNVAKELAEECMVHPIEYRAMTAILPPVMSKDVDTEPLAQVVFREDCIITTCFGGHIKTWDRPKTLGKGAAAASQVTLSAAGSQVAS